MGKPDARHPRARLGVSALAGIVCGLCAVLPVGSRATAGEADGAEPPLYEQRTPSRDGTGRIYMGREISRVMGHRGAQWLTRPEREREERTDLLLENLELEPDHVVVDLGAGTGFFSLPIARKVPQGRVLAVDIQSEMLERVRRNARFAGLDNIEPVLASETDPRIPEATADLVLLVDAYHEFSHPREVMQTVVSGLKPGGRVVLVEYRAEDPEVPIKPLHKMSEAQAIRELEAVGLRWRETRGFLPRQHVLVFEKPAGEPRPSRPTTPTGAAGDRQGPLN